MKDSINSVISIDNKTRELVKNTEDEITALREDLQKKLVDMENKSLEEAKNEAQAKFESIKKSFEAKEQSILLENKEKAANVESGYLKEEKTLIDRAISIILNEEDYE